MTRITKTEYLAIGGPYDRQTFFLGSGNTMPFTVMKDNILWKGYYTTTMETVGLLGSKKKLFGLRWNGTPNDSSANTK